MLPGRVFAGRLFRRRRVFRGGLAAVVLAPRRGQRNHRGGKNQEKKFPGSTFHGSLLSCPFPVASGVHDAAEPVHDSLILHSLPRPGKRKIGFRPVMPVQGPEFKVQGSKFKVFPTRNAEGGTQAERGSPAGACPESRRAGIEGSLRHSAPPAPHGA